MQNKVAKYLSYKGYQGYVSNEPQISYFIKPNRRSNGIFRVIQMIDMDGEKNYTVEQINKNCDMIRKAFPDQDVKILTVLCGTRFENSKVLQANVENLWLLNKRNGKIDLGNTDDVDWELEELLSHRMNPNWMQESWVIVLLVVANLLIFGIMRFFGNMDDSLFMVKWGGLYSESIKNDGEYWRLFTCMFLHFDLMHLLNNMLVLVTVGKYVKNGLGNWGFLFAYIAAGLGGSICSLLRMFREGGVQLSAGASGAIFGLVGALLAIVIVHKGKFEDLGLKQILLMIALMCYYTIMSVGVDDSAHFGGLVVGFCASMLLLAFRSKNKYT